MKYPSILFVVIALGLFSPTEEYRILAIFPLCSKSHQMVFDALMDGLSRRGHQIDVVTCFPPREPIPNVNVIFNVENTQTRLVNNWNFSMAIDAGTDSLKLIGTVYGNDLCHIMGYDEIQSIVKNPPSDPPYDLAIVEALASSCFIGFGTVLKVPVVWASASLELPWIDQAIGNPTNNAFFPAFFTEHYHPMSFWERVKNTYTELSNVYRFNSITGDAQNELMRKYLGANIPDVRELEKSVALVLVNSFHSLTGVRPTTTNLIQIGGIHVENNNAKLTKELTRWLDDSNDGVVYFTLGSMVNIETMPEDTIKELYNAFQKISPVRVLMKVANSDKLLPGLPDNVMTSSWIPQVPVLAHKNTRVFMTHGGLMSTQESLYHGVPLLGIPLFGDQPMNMRYYVVKGMAEMLSPDNINEKSVSTALNSLLNDPKYRHAANRQSALFRDRPMSASDTACYWVEYAVRNGADAIRSPAIDLAWWQILLLDVYGFFLTVIIVAVGVIVLFVKLLVKIVFSPFNHSATKGVKRD